MQFSTGPAAVGVGIVCLSAAILPWWAGNTELPPLHPQKSTRARYAAKKVPAPEAEPAALQNCTMDSQKCTVAVEPGQEATAADDALTTGQADSAPAAAPASGAAAPATQPRTLVRSGRLVFDANRLSRIHARFAGNVVSIGQVQSGDATDQGRPLRFGDPVKQGQVLAVIWSRELAEKKSELLSALAQVELDTQLVARLARARRGSEEERLKNEAEQHVKEGVMTVARIERTLHSWRIDEEAIAAIRTEAQRMRRERRASDGAREREWAEFPVRSPIDGVVLECTASVGEAVDPQHDLFKICDVNTLGVTIDVYEEDLPALEALAPEARQWTVRLTSEPATAGIPGSFDLIAHLVDPRRHTISVLGTIDNSQHLMRAGQFVTAEIPLR